MDLRWGWLVDGGGGKKEVMWQCLSHSCHIWDTMGHRGGIHFHLSNNAGLAQLTLGLLLSL